MITILALVSVLQDGGDFDGTTYHVGHHEKFINITFESEADLETIVGTSNTATGTVKVNLREKKGFVALTVPVASLKTGIDMRDEHLRGKMWLDAAAHPDIRFESKKIEFGEDGEGEVAGAFTLHGVTRNITVAVRWKALPADAAARAKFPAGDWIKFTAEFDVKLSDYGVKVPDGAVGKVEDRWRVKMTIFAGTAKPQK